MSEKKGARKISKKREKFFHFLFFSESAHSFSSTGKRFSVFFALLALFASLLENSFHFFRRTFFASLRELFHLFTLFSSTAPSHSCGSLLRKNNSLFCTLSAELISLLH